MDNKKKKLSFIEKVGVFVERIRAYLFRHRKFFMSFTAAIVVIIVAIFSLDYYQTYQQKKIAAAFYEVEKSIDIQDADATELQENLTALQQFISLYPKSRHSVIARFYTAHIYYKQKKWKAAIEVLEEITVTQEEDSLFHIIASMYLVNAYVEKGDINRSIELLEQNQYSAIGDYRIFELAMLYIIDKKTSLAKDRLKFLIDEYKEGEYKELAIKIRKIL